MQRRPLTLLDRPFEEGVIHQSEGGTPERIIQVPGCVDAWRLDHVCRLHRQTRPPKVLTDAECMPDLTVQ